MVVIKKTYPQGISLLCWSAHGQCNKVNADGSYYRAHLMLGKPVKGRKDHCLLEGNKLWKQALQTTSAIN